MDKLNVEKTAAAALAKAEALEAALEYENDGLYPKLRGGSEQQSHNGMRMTEEYVQKHSILDSSLKPEAQLQGSPTTTQPQQTPPSQAPAALAYQSTQFKPERKEDPQIEAHRSPKCSSTISKKHTEHWGHKIYDSYHLPLATPMNNHQQAYQESRIGAYDGRHYPPSRSVHSEQQDEVLRGLSNENSLSLSTLSPSKQGHATIQVSCSFLVLEIRPRQTNILIKT